MKNPLRRTDDGQKISFIPNLSQVFFNTECYETVRRGGAGSNRLVLLCLGLLNIVLLIVAVALGITCAKVREGSIHVSHSAAKQLIDELSFLRSNHSDVIEAEQAAKYALESAVKNHAQLKKNIGQQKINNDNYHKQIDELQTEMLNLQANMTAMEGNCGRCLPQWILHNSSCYYFSNLDSENVKKNWADSRADCVQRGGDLIVIDNKEEQKYVSDSALNLKYSYDRQQDGFWIGLTDIKTEGTWVWINNVTEVEQRYWMEEEMDDYGLYGHYRHHRHYGPFGPQRYPRFGQEDCAAASYSSDNPWKTRYDTSCNNARHWICEMTSM